MKNKLMHALTGYRLSRPAPRGRSFWLRWGDPSRLPLVDVRWGIGLSAVGHAAARETLVTTTAPLEAMWVGLFEELLKPGTELVWLGNGPGIGRDLRIAYSSLLGRYLARAYLTEYEGVRVLVSLDEAARCLKNAGYSIKRDPQYRGHQADWIGYDDDGLVIVEAKGTFEKVVGRWRGPMSTPRILDSAINQARNTVVYRGSQALPAKRWAVASRWGTERNRADPTLIACFTCGTTDDCSDVSIPQDLISILARCDVNGVMRGLAPAGGVPSQRFIVRVGSRVIESGFVAMIGPFGVRVFRDSRDNSWITAARELDSHFGLVSMSDRYLMAVDRLPSIRSEAADEEPIQYEGETGHRFAYHAGLTVVWPDPTQEVFLDPS